MLSLVSVSVWVLVDEYLGSVVKVLGMDLDAWMKILDEEWMVKVMSCG